MTVVLEVLVLGAADADWVSTRLVCVFLVADPVVLQALMMFVFVAALCGFPCCVPVCAACWLCLLALALAVAVHYGGLLPLRSP